MSSQNVEQVQSSAQNVAATSSVAADQVSAAGSVSSNTNQKELKMSDTISSLAELREKAPEVYNQMLQGIAMNICGQMKHQQERLKQVIRDGQRS